MKLGPAWATVPVVAVLVTGVFGAFTAAVHPAFYAEPLPVVAATLGWWLLGGLLCGLAIVLGMALHYTDHGAVPLDRSLLEQGTTRRVVVPVESGTVLARARAAVAQQGRVAWVVDDPEGGTLVGTLRDSWLAVPGVDETWVSVVVRPVAGGTELSLRRRARVGWLAVHSREDAVIEAILDLVLAEAPAPEPAAQARTQRRAAYSSVG